MINGRKFYVHIVERGQTVYSISRAYRVDSYDAVTHVDIHALHPGDTVWLPFRGQLADMEEQSAKAPASTPVPTITLVDTVYVHNTTYVNVPYAVHDTAYINVPYAVHDTTYINVPYAVHDTTVVTDTVTLTKYVTVRDTSIVTETVTLTEYVPVHDTTYVNVPYAVHDTAYINVPYAVHDTTVVTDTVTLTEYVPAHDTTFVTDTVTLTKYVTVRDTSVVTDTVTLTEYVPVHDTTYINVPYTVYDTTVITDTVTLTMYVTVRDTTVVTDTVTLTEYVPVHDTTFVTDTMTLTQYVTVRDTSIVTETVTLTEYVPVHDTTFVTDTVTLTKYVTVRDTTVITDTVTLTKYVTVRDTSIVTDTVTLTEYVQVHDTTYIAVRDTTYINVPYTVYDTTVITDTVTLTKYVTVRDTSIVTDTVTLTEYVQVHDTTYIAVHDTTFVVDTVNFEPSSDLAFASASPVALTEYVLASQATLTPDSPATELSRRKVGKTLKVGLMMPLHLNQMEQISTSKFDVEQRGKKSYRQFEFIEFYEGLLLALDRLSEDGISVELNVVDVSDNTAAQVERAFASHNMAQSDVIVALLLREAFDKAAELARQAGVYIVNPMATRSELCAENPYMVKIQPSVEGMITLMLNNMVAERPNAHLYIIHSGSKEERSTLDEVKRQLEARTDIAYTIFNWSQSAKLTGLLKKTPNCNVLSIYDQNKDNNRVYVGNLLNKLAAFKSDSPTLYTLNDWTREYIDVDFSQLQQSNYHTFSTSWDMTNEVHVNFLKAYRSRFGTEPSSALASTGYDLMLYIGHGLNRKNSDFWLSPTNTLPYLMQPIHLHRHGAGLENDRAQLYRMENLHFIKATVKNN